MKAFIAVIIMAFALAGCADGSLSNLTLSNGKPITKSLVISKCPVLKQYTQAQLEAAAMELDNLPTESELAKMVIDYGKLREACRAITAKLKK